MRDDEAQAERARRVIECGERVLITDVVLAEMVWTQTDRRYRATRADLIDLVNKLLHDANLRFEDDEVVWSALQALENGGGFRHRPDRMRGPKYGNRRWRVERFLHFR